MSPRLVMSCCLVLSASALAGDPDRTRSMGGGQPWDVEPYTPPPPPPAYQAVADRAVKDLVAELVQSICDKQKLGKTKKVTQTSVPESRAVADELKYLAERIVDYPTQWMGLDQEFNQSLSYLLFHSEQPTLTGAQNPFVKFTKDATVTVPDVPVPVSRELALAMKVAKAGNESLAPKDVLGMALEVTGGDYPAAALVAHNFLKEITYSGRSRFEATFDVGTAGSSGNEADDVRRKRHVAMFKNTGFTVYPRGNGQLNIGMVSGAPDLAGKLKNLRGAGDPHGGDKMGPWYHSFGVLFLSSTAKGGRYTAETWAQVEGLARHVPFFSSKPDYFKELFTNAVGARSGAILDCLNQDVATAEPPKPPPPAPPPPRPAVGGTSTSLTLELPGYWGHLSYTITGARLEAPTGSDRGKVGGRQYQGVLAGDTLTVSGTAVSDNPSSGPGSGDYYELTVSVTVGSQHKEYSYIAPKGEKLNRPFNLSVPIEAGASGGSFRISLLDQNANYGPHGWVVDGSLTRAK